MATLTIRNLPESTRSALRRRAAAHDRSMEAEVRDILESAVRPQQDWVSAWVQATADAGVELELPPRSPAREVDLG